jgi:hypothetical protein
MSDWLDLEVAEKRRNELLREAGYRRRIDGWCLDTTRSLEGRTELPAGGWRRALARFGAPAVPFFRVFRGNTRGGPH